VLTLKSIGTNLYESLELVNSVVKGTIGADPTTLNRLHVYSTATISRYRPLLEVNIRSAHDHDYVPNIILYPAPEHQAPRIIQLANKMKANVFLRESP